MRKGCNAIQKVRKSEKMRIEGLNGSKNGAYQPSETSTSGADVAISHSEHCPAAEIVTVSLYGVAIERVGEVEALLTSIMSGKHHASVVEQID